MAIHNNELQIIVTALQRYYAPTDAKITPRSRKLKDGTGTPREIDVLVEYNDGGLPVVVAVEAKDWRKPLDQPVVESYIGKYNSIGGVTVDKVIIVGRSFYEPARLRAQMLGFALHTVQTLNEQVVSLFHIEERTPDQKRLSSETPRERVTPYLIGADGKGVIPDPKEEGFLIHCHTGLSSGRPSQWCERLAPQLLSAVQKARVERPGFQIHGELEVALTGYSLRRLGRDQALSHLALVSQRSAVMPMLTAKAHEIVVNDDKPTEMVIESAEGAFGRFEIVYERPLDGASPKSFRLHQTMPDGSDGAPTAILKMRV